MQSNAAYPQPAVPGRFGLYFCGFSAASALPAVVVAGVPGWDLPVPLPVCLWCRVGSHQAPVPTVEGVPERSHRFLAANASPCPWSSTCHHMQHLELVTLILMCRLSISVGRILSCKMRGVLTGGLQRSAPEACSVYVVHSLSRTRLFLVIPHNPSPANPQALFFCYLWVLATPVFVVFCMQLY